MRNRLLWKIERAILLWLLLPAPIWAALCPADLLPFERSYDLYRNDKQVGQVYMRLSREGDTWRLDSRTAANRGLTGLLGAEIREWVRFRCQQGRYLPLESEYERKLLFSKRRTHLRYDWDALRVRGEHRGKPVDRVLVPGMVDRLGVQLLLPSDWRAGRALDYQVQDRHRPRHWQFVPAEAPVSPPPGMTGAQAFHRLDSKPKRETWFWLHVNESQLPVQWFHREEKARYLSRLSSPIH